MGKHQEAFYEMLATRGNPAPRGGGAFAEFEYRMKKELGARGEYPVDAHGEPLANPYRMNPAEMPDRLSPAEMEHMRLKLKRLLDSGVSHAEVRAQFGLSYPKYMAILRSGRKARPARIPGSKPTAPGTAHLLQNPFGYGD
jgi:hypothetical protein